jgi:hypothetical protein
MRVYYLEVPHVARVRDLGDETHQFLMVACGVGAVQEVPDTSSSESDDEAASPSTSASTSPVPNHEVTPVSATTVMTGAVTLVLVLAALAALVAKRYSQWRRFRRHGSMKHPSFHQV